MGLEIYANYFSYYNKINAKTIRVALKSETFDSASTFEEMESCICGNRGF